ncbi:MAG TPA: cation transporter [Gemmatimonadales bacterium]
MQKLTLHITGMSCGHCLNAVSQALHALPGVKVESVQMGRAVVSYDERAVKPDAIERAVSDAGYAATAA